MKIPGAFVSKSSYDIVIGVRRISDNEMRVRGIYTVYDWYEANCFDMISATETVVLHALYCIHENVNNLLLQ